MPALALISTRREFHTLFDVYLAIATGVFAVMTLLIVGAALRFRRRSAAEASRRSEHNPLEIGYASVLVATVAFLLFLTFRAEHRVDTVALRERPALVVNVSAAKWEWRFSYPGYGIVHWSGVVGRQPLVVPADQVVRFNLTSSDVIHAFWIPALDFKRDAIPGAIERIALTFTQTGLFPAQCAEFCGLRHPEMVFNTRVVSPAAFHAWARSGGRLTSWRSA